MLDERVLDLQAAEAAWAENRRSTAVIPATMKGLLRLETARGFSRATLNTLLKNAGLEAHTLAGGKTADKKGGIILLAANSFVGAADKRLERLRRDLGESVPLIVPVGVAYSEADCEHVGTTVRKLAEQHLS